MSSEEIIQPTQVSMETEKIITPENSTKRLSFMEMVSEKQNDQDFKQKMNVASTLLLEIYRVLMGAFLVVFVPFIAEIL